MQGVYPLYKRYCAINQVVMTNRRFIQLVFTLCIGLGTLMQWNTATAQELPTRYPTLELYTNTPCPICGSQNPGLFNRLEAYEGQYHLISFYPGSPYMSCIFYQANIAENTVRRNFYPIFGTPTVAINGLQFSNSNGVTTTVLDNVTGLESWLHVDVNESTGNTRTVDITLEDHVGGSLASGKLFAAIVEREIMYNAPNGETVHYNVFRRFLTNVNGEDVDLSSGTASLSYEYTVDASWQADEVYIIAWLMNPANKEIINSGTRFDPDFTSSTDDDPVALKLNIYPNPASSEIHIALPQDVRNAPIRIYNSGGQLVYETLSYQDPTPRINITNWPVGNYHVEIDTEVRIIAGSFQLVR